METSKLAPRGAIRNYAGGGEISPWSLRGMAGAVSNAFADTPEQLAQKRNIAQYKAEKAAAAAAPAQAPTPAPAPGTISGYAGMTALQQREKAAGLKNGGVVKNCVTGGAIRGKGTATSDEIPIMASNGEFMIKASSVKKIGIEALEALNALGDAPDEKDSKAEAQREYGKQKGAVRKMAKGGPVVDEEEKRQNLIAQIPATQGAFPAPAPDGKDNTEFSRNVGNTLNALPGASPAIGAISTLARAVPVVGNAIPAIGAGAASLVEKVAPYAVPVAGFGALSAASQPNPTPAPQTGSSSTIAPVPTAASQPTGPVQPATAPTDGTTPARLNGVDGKNVGYGATRFDLPGKSPLFTNMTDAAGLADNAKLMGRGAVTAQNQSAMDGIQARQDAGDQAARNKTQYDQEVAAANAVNKWQSERGMNARALASRRDNETARRGQDIQAGALRDSQKLAQDKFAQESKGSAIDQQGKLQIQTLQTALLAEKDPSKRLQLEDNLRALQGKYEKPVPAPKYTVYNLPDTVDVNGQIVRGGQGALDVEGRPIDIRPQAKPVPPAHDIARLQSNPSEVAKFEAIYGKGSAAQYLGKK